MTPTKLRSLTFDEYLVYNDGTDNRYELVRGELLLMNPPTGQHSLIIRFLNKAIDAEIERLNLPWIALRDVGVRTGVNSSRLPDLCVLTIEQVKQILDVPAVLQSPALLAIEVVSPGTGTTDYRQKRSEYAAIGVSEYWIIDSLTQKVSVLKIEQGFYELTEFQGNLVVISQVFPELELTTNQILSTKV